MKLLGILQVVGNSVIVDNETCSIFKRRKCTDGQTVGTLGKGLTEYVWFNYKDRTYLGFFGIFFGKYQIKKAIQVKKIDPENVKCLIFPKKDRTAKRKGMSHGHSSINRTAMLQCYSLERYDFDNQITELKQLYSNHPIENVEGVSLAELNQLQVMYSGKELKKKLHKFLEIHDIEMKRRQMLEEKTVELDIGEDVTIDKATLIAGKRIEVA